ncbi:MAG: redoxin domain-containing protein [Fimbriimonadaceae bacterium]
MIAAMALAGPPQLSICDKAPPLRFGAAIKGSPVQAFSKSRVTVVEFWATWCKPCIQIMPHLSELWAKYKGSADFVSVSVMEDDPSKVKPFVKSMGDKMAYPVVIDKLDGEGKGYMYTNWLLAAKQEAIPVAFIVDKEANIAWIGHPSQLEAVLLKVIDGSWDARAYKLRFEAQAKDEDASSRLVDEAYGTISGTPRTHSYVATLTWIEDNRSKYDGPETQAALNEFKSLFSAFAEEEYETALKLSEAEPKNGLVWTYFRPMLVVARIDALQSLNRSEWRDVANAAVDGPPDPNILMALADSFTLPDSKLAQKDAAISLKAGERLAGLARVPMFLLRLAWAQYADGQTDVAKATLTEALSKMDEEKKRNPRSYDGLMARLKEAKSFFDQGKR